MGPSSTTGGVAPRSHGSPDHWAGYRERVQIDHERWEGVTGAVTGYGRSIALSGDSLCGVPRMGGTTSASSRWAVVDVTPVVPVRTQ